MLERDEVLKQNFIYFNKKTLIMSAWTLLQEINKDKLARIPVWVRFPQLDYKYWRKKGLSKLGSLLGKPLATDNATQNKLLTKFT